MANRSVLAVCRAVFPVFNGFRKNKFFQILKKNKLKSAVTAVLYLSSALDNRQTGRFFWFAVGF
jgi:hypothetical protein